MDIHGLENLSPQQLDQEISRGGKLVVFEYCVSLLKLSSVLQKFILSEPKKVLSAKASVSRSFR